jgi:GrpB-like predicted nucleotidyltransferase (UPF0157 family)
MQRVAFVKEESVRALVRSAFRRHQRRLRRLLPEAEILHVGSTAVRGSLTKGDLDIQVRVPGEQFRAARAILAAHYARNTGSPSTPTFASFEQAELAPSLGIQLTVAGSRYDIFWQITAYLAAHGEVNERYNALKLRYDGRSMAAYRRAKSRFLEALLSEARRHCAGFTQRSSFAHLRRSSSA